MRTSALRVDPSPESFLLLRLARQVFPSRNLVALVAEHQQTGQNGRSGLNSTGGTTQLTEWLRKEGIERRFLSHTDSPSGFGPDGTCPDSERFDLAAALQECAIAKSSYLVIPTTLADQVDLLAYRIARQSGLGGLCGLQSSESVVPNASDARTVQVLRPFLELPEVRHARVWDISTIQFCLKAYARMETRRD